MLKRTLLTTSISLSLFGSLSFTGLAAAAETEETLGAYAAGYRAAFTCSAVFNANKEESAIIEHELTGIYDQVATRIGDLSATVDRDNKWVSVDYLTSGETAMPPRISVWRPHLGCVQLPVGATTDVIDELPVTSLAELALDGDSGEPWRKRVEVNAQTANDALNDVISNAFSQHYGDGSRTSAVLIASPSEILAEHYIDGFSPTTSQRTWSVAKSIGASVIGVAVQQELLQTNDPAGLENWSHPADPRRQITLDNLLHMASGLDSNVAGNRTDRLYLGGGLVSDTSTENALEVPPGKRWKYANNDTVLALRALRERFDNVQDYLDFPFTQLLDKIGMQHTQLETDWQGDFILSSQVWTTSRDLARLGVLHLQNGEWQGEQILPKDWVSYISKPAPAQPPEKSGSGASIPGYGAQWWLFNERYPQLPNDTIAARGNRGQYLVVIPSENLVIVRRGYDLAGEEPFNEAQFVEDVLAALAAD